ncbi:MAG TPA: hypothetical protein VGD43_22805, partial [Micromonospora sp.]
MSERSEREIKHSADESQDGVRAQRGTGMSERSEREIKHSADESQDGVRARNVGRRRGAARFFTPRRVARIAI